MKTKMIVVRRHCIWIIVLLFGSNIISTVQVHGQPFCGKINTIPIEITWSKTTTLIFPAAIKNVDRGSRDILAQKVSGIENILQLKAGKTDFPETNLTVVTGDGKLHHFTVIYAHNPEELIFEIGKAGYTELMPALFDSPMTASKFAEYPDEIISTDKKGRLMGRTKNKISFYLKGLHIRENVIFCHIKIKNRSNINYDMDFLKFYIRDKKQFKRTASQEHVLNPIYAHGDIGSAIKSQSETDFVYALEKFTIPDARHFVIELYEKHGGRHMGLSVKNRMIVNAKPIY